MGYQNFKLSGLGIIFYKNDISSVEFNLAKKMIEGQFSGWRIPTLYELRIMMTFLKDIEGEGIGNFPPPNRRFIYWSNETVNDDYAFGLDITTGDLIANHKKDRLRLRFVKDII